MPKAVRQAAKKTSGVRKAAAYGTLDQINTAKVKASKVKKK